VQKIFAKRTGPNREYDSYDISTLEPGWVKVKSIFGKLGLLGMGP
jgi:hypothetical protein